MLADFSPRRPGLEPRADRTADKDSEHQPDVEEVGHDQMGEEEEPDSPQRADDRCESPEMELQAAAPVCPLMICAN